MSDGLEFPVRCPLCMTELYSSEELREHVIPELKRLMLARLREADRPSIEKAQREAALAEVTPSRPRSMGRLFTDRFVANYAIDPYTLVGMSAAQIDAVTERIEESLWREVATQLQSLGVDIPRESVVVASFEETDAWRRVRWMATWSPDPMKGVSLRGGPLDGETLALERSDTAGRPIPYLRSIQPKPLDFLHAEKQGIELLQTVEVTYRRAGIDPDADCWVYEWQP